MPYRPAIALLNRIRHEPVDGGTPLRTAAAFRIDDSAATAFYENPIHTMNVSMDDVGVKKQKASGRAPHTPAKDHRE